MDNFSFVWILMMILELPFPEGIAVVSRFPCYTWETGKRPATLDGGWRFPPQGNGWETGNGAIRTWF